MFDLNNPIQLNNTNIRIQNRNKVFWKDEKNIWVSIGAFVSHKGLCLGLHELHYYVNDFFGGLTFYIDIYYLAIKFLLPKTNWFSLFDTKTFSFVAKRFVHVNKFVLYVNSKEDPHKYVASRMLYCWVFGCLVISTWGLDQKH